MLPHLLTYLTLRIPNINDARYVLYESEMLNPAKNCTCCVLASANHRKLTMGTYLYVATPTYLPSRTPNINDARYASVRY